MYILVVRGGPPGNIGMIRYYMTLSRNLTYIPYFEKAMVHVRSAGIVICCCVVFALRVFGVFVLIFIGV